MHVNGIYLSSSYLTNNLAVFGQGVALEGVETKKAPIRALFCITNLAEAVRFELTNPFGSPVFKTGAFNHSATLPLWC